MSRLAGLRVTPIFLLLLCAPACTTQVIDPLRDEGAASGAPAVATAVSSSGGDSAHRVRDMTTTEARAWCDRYVNVRYPSASGSPPTRPMDDPFHNPVNGYVVGYAASYCWQLEPGGGCAVQPTVDDCVTNLLHAPCEATVGDLDDCVDSYFLTNTGSVVQQCTVVGQGCGPFKAAAHCSETVIMSWVDQPIPATPNATPGCYLRIAPE